MTATEEMLRLVGDQALGAGHRMIDSAGLKATCEGQGLSHDDWFTGLVELRTAGLVQMRDHDGKVALCS